MGLITDFASKPPLRLFASVLLAILASTTALAAGVQKPSRFRTVAILDVGSNLYPLGSEPSALNSSILLIPTYRLSDDWSVGMIASAFKGWTDDRPFQLFDPSFRVNYRAVYLNPFLTVSPGVWMVLPVNERSRTRDSLMTAVRPTLRFATDTSKARSVSLRKAWASYEVGLSRSFHQYQTSTTGAVNTAWRLSNWVNAGYSLTSKWSLSADFIRNTAWSYAGGMRHSFSLGESLSYQYSPKVSLSIGHTNEGDVLRANGLSSNVSIVDPAGSRIFSSIMVIF